MLSEEFKSFYDRWLAKADNYGIENLRDCFDKFISYYIVYNRLYAEVTFGMARDDEIDLTTRSSFPDSHAAKNYVMRYLGATEIINQLNEDESTNAAIEEIKNHIRDHSFYIKLNMVTGERQPEVDEQLLANFESTNINHKAFAVLDTIYSIRCNLLHGHKSFEQNQTEILIPSITILRKLCDLLYNRLSSNN